MVGAEKYAGRGRCRKRDEDTPRHRGKTGPDMATQSDGVGFRSTRGPILIALMLSSGLVAIDATIVATAVPSIVHEIGGFASFPWLFSAYLLAQAVSVPVYAKLSDMAGRKPIILTGIGLFLLGSILCGLAWSMPALIAFRVVQGLGAGAVLPVAITIAGDIYTLAERAKVQGYLASVWATSSVVGPTLGGVFSSLGAWRGIFLVNIPLCLVAAWMLVQRFHENIERVKHRVDYLGAALLTFTLTLTILGALEGGQAWAWDSPISIAVFALGAVLLVAFILVERRAAEPVLPPWVVSRRLLATTALISFGAGAVVLGLTSYVPTFLQGALSVSPITAGLSLAALTIGWPISASQSGRFYLRIGFRTTSLIGISVTVIGSAALAITAYTPNLVLRRGQLLCGGARPRPPCNPEPDRSAVQCRMARARCGDGHQPLRAVHRQFAWCGSFRGGRQRNLRRPPGWRKEFAGDCVRVCSGFSRRACERRTDRRRRPRNAPDARGGDCSAGQGAGPAAPESTPTKRAGRRPLGLRPPASNPSPPRGGLASRPPLRTTRTFVVCGSDCSGSWMRTSRTPSSYVAMMPSWLTPRGSGMLRDRSP